jgi:Fic family protein
MNDSWGRFMDPANFAASSMGIVMPAVPGGYAFVPKTLPRQIDVGSLAPLLSEASMALGELKGIGRFLPNPYLLIRPLQRKEAVASSNIEGTFTNLSDLFLLEAGADEKDRPPDTREVMNYVHALEHAVERLAELPVCLRLMREIHEILLRGVRTNRGANVTPGEFKTTQNWIGGATIQSARFVPPPPLETIECLRDFENFIHDEEALKLPSLIYSAMIHYQFETIHPFPDGNGRVGRLLIPLILCEKGILPQPLLYMSPFFERNRDEYIDNLFSVSSTGNSNRWFSYFLRGVIEQCHDTVTRIKDLQDLHSQYRQKLQQARASALLGRLADELIGQPFITVPMIQRRLGVTYRGAQLNVERLIQEGMLREMGIGERPRWYVAYEVFEIIHR